MSPGTCPAAILMAEPVIKPLIAGAGINSTIQPILRRPIPSTMKPHMKETAVAMTWGSHFPGWSLFTAEMIWETVNDITATGPMETSFDVAKN